MYALFHAAACHATLGLTRGEPVTWRSSYSAAWSRAGSYIWLMILTWLAVAAPFLVLLHSGRHSRWFAVRPPQSGPGPRSGLFAAAAACARAYSGSFVWMVWMALRLGLAFPACVAEGISAADGLRRSVRLTVKAKGRMFLVLLGLVYAVSYAAAILMEMLAFSGMAILGLLGAGMHLSTEQPAAVTGMVVMGIVFCVAFLLWGALIYACYSISLSVLYQDQCLRIDGGPHSPLLQEFPHEPISAPFEPRRDS